MAGAGDEGPAEDKEWFPMPPYLCYRCQSELPRKEHDAHLARCIGPSDDVPSDQRVVLKLQAQAFQGVFRLTLLATPSATMAGLDEVLRKTWCEPCCRGHASQLLLHDVALGPPTPFVSPQSSTARPVQCSRDGDSLRDCHRLPYDTRLMDRLVHSNEVVGFQYDTASPMDCLVLVEGPMRVSARVYDDIAASPLQILVVIQNKLPVIPCHACRNRALWALRGTSGIEDLDERHFYCHQHKPKKAPLTEIFNSPRTAGCHFPSLAMSPHHRPPEEVLLLPESAMGGEVVVVLSDPEEDPAEGTAGRGGDEGRSRQTRSGRRDGANAEAGTSGVQGTQGRGGGAREARTAKKGGGGRGRKRGARTSRGVAKRSRNAKAARSDTPAQKSGKRRVSQQASSIEQDGEGQGLVGHITRMLGSVVQAAKNVWEGAFA